MVGLAGSAVSKFQRMANWPSFRYSVRKSGSRTIHLIQDRKQNMGRFWPSVRWNSEPAKRAKSHYSKTLTSSSSRLLREQDPFFQRPG